MRSGGWDVALDAQNDLRAGLQTRDGQRFLSGFAESLSRPHKMFDPETGQTIDAGDPETARQGVQTAVTAVEAGDPVWVSEEVIDLVEFAAETFEPDAVYPDELFVPAAFCYLERSLPMVDAHGKTTHYRALSWMRWEHSENPGKQGVVIALWSHRDDPDDYNAERIEQGITLPLLGASPLSLLHVSGALPFGDKRMLVEGTHRRLFKQVQVLWRLAKQEIVVPGHQQVSRPVWRRKSNWRQIKTVQVLTLRRSKPRRYDGEEREVEWSHRWWVRGHWRWQPYRISGETVRCQIWIDGYVKGPEDKPFVAKKRAVEFIR